MADEAPKKRARTQPLLVEVTEDYVRDQMKSNDASHDWAHICRVRTLALNIAKLEGLGKDAEQIEIIELAALLHDIADWKYSGSETAGPTMAYTFLVQNGCPTEKAKIISTIISLVSFHSEIGASGGPKLADTTKKCLHVVQDADRLDAIGAIGIARALTFGGKKNRALYNYADPDVIWNSKYSHTPPSKEAYKKSKADTVQHFYDKLLLLSKMMKTTTGQKLAKQRHDVMETFLKQLHKEVNGHETI